VLHFFLEAIIIRASVQCMTGDRTALLHVLDEARNLSAGTVCMCSFSVYRMA